MGIGGEKRVGLVADGNVPCVASIMTIVNVAAVPLTIIRDAVAMATTIVTVGWRKGAINGLQVLPNGFLSTHHQGHPGKQVLLASWATRGPRDLLGRRASTINPDKPTGSLVHCYWPRLTPITMYKLGDRGVGLPL